MFTDITEEFSGLLEVIEWKGNPYQFGKYEKILRLIDLEETYDGKRIYSNRKYIMHHDYTTYTLRNYDLSYKEGYVIPVLLVVNKHTYETVSIPIQIEYCVCDKKILDVYRKFANSSSSHFKENVENIIENVKKTCTLI